ncbi:uncharacterized protein [Cardiocondyla obscurior]|uniref:uncharacterized protein n=1 Tax=Cardiocondyla obscurior TaxID=286306 RepID=UPI003965756F
MEEIASSQSGTADEQECEAHFNKHVETNKTGRYVVRSPMKAEVAGSLGESREIAVKRFASLERRLSETRFREAYIEFMREYARLDHIQEVSADEINKLGAISLPHHGILKENGSNAKLRRYAGKYPIGAEHVQRGFYVDDVLTGADTVAETKRAREEIVQILKLGQFELGKLVSNYAALLPERVDRSEQAETFDREQTTKVLGVWWDPAVDEFRFDESGEIGRRLITKRVILAEIAGLFDPMGFLGPTTVMAKILLQEIWQLKLDWDESLPQEVHSRWAEFRSQLAYLGDIRIPRCVNNTGANNVQLHGFCDASEKACGACVYVRASASVGQPKVTLLASKSRVAPIKAVSLPRLELCAANLLADLMQRICAAFEKRKYKKYL